jgi:heparin/heparan-sulfate lyase
LTKDFGPILGSVIARTGWQIDLTSNDVVAEIKGGGYHFGNHQHSDAGSLQIYYRGFQVADLGLYGFYGTPYDMNFNKRSIAHSMMLVRDPEEKFLSTESNDGGTRFNQRHPDSPEIAKTDPWFHNGSVVSSDFGPSKVRPSFSYFSVDLASAYSSKVEAYQRGFCFLNLEKDSIPAAIILTDDIQAADPAFKKYWQINTHNLPEITTNGVILNNRRGGLVGKTYVEMLVPQPNEKTVEVFSGDDANSSFEFAYEVPGRINHRPYPEMTGHRIMVTPKAERKHDRFLTVFQMVAGNTNPLPVTCTETEVSYIVTIADRVVSMSKRGLINSGFTFEISAGDTNQVLLAGLNAGTWHIKSRNGKTDLRLNVADGKNTIFFQGGNGEYSVMPE